MINPALSASWRTPSKGAEGMAVSMSKAAAHVVSNRIAVLRRDAIQGTQEPR
jgi:hypothetical protein